MTVLPLRAEGSLCTESAQCASVKCVIYSLFIFTCLRDNVEELLEGDQNVSGMTTSSEFYQA